MMEKFNFGTPKPVENKKIEKLEQKDFLEAKIENDIVPILKILGPEGDSFESYKNEVVAQLLEDTQKIEKAEGRLVPNPDYTVAKMKEVLIERLKSAVKDSHDYSRKKQVDESFVKKAKVALISEGDFSDWDKQYNGNLIRDGKLDLEMMNADSLFNFYLDAKESNSDDGKKLNAEEIKALIKSGLGPLMATISDYNYHDYIRETPDEYIQVLLNSDRGGLMSRIFEGDTLKKGLSRETFNLLIEKDLAYLANKKIHVFEKSITPDDLKSLIKNYGPEYPYHLRDIIPGINKLNFTNEEKSEIFDFAFSHQYVSDSDYNVIENEKIREKYKNINDGVNEIIKRKDHWEKITPESQSKENLDKLKKYIEDGYITFFYGQSEYLIFFAKNDYDWLLSQAVKHNQENLLFSGSGYKNLLKPEDEKKYARKLIDQNDIPILKNIIDKNLFTAGIFGNDEFVEFTNAGINLDKHVRLFEGLSGDIYEKLMESKKKSSFFELDNFLVSNISRFNFESEKYEKELKYQEYVAHIKSCFNDNLEKFLPYFRDSFVFSKFDIENKSDKEKYITNLSEFLKKISIKMFVGNPEEMESNYDWTKVGEAILDEKTHHSNFSKEQCLGQEEYDTLEKYGISCKDSNKLTFFYGLNEETLKSIVGKNTKWSDFNSIIGRFDLSEDSEYQKIYKETESVSTDHNIREFYFNNYSDKPEEERSRIRQIITDGQLVSNNSVFLLKFIDRLNTFDLQGPEYSKIISEIKKNKNINPLLNLHEEIFARYLDFIGNKELSPISNVYGVFPEYATLFKDLKEEDRKILQNIIPWSNALLKIEGVQKQSQNKQHDPWSNSFVPLMRNLGDNKMIDFDNPTDGEFTLDFIKRFGMKNIPQLFKLFIDIKRAGSLDSLDGKTLDILKNDFGIKSEELLKNDKSNINLIINQIEKFQLDLFSKFLNEDESIIKRSIDSSYLLEMIEIMKGNSGFGHGGETKVVITKYLETLKSNPEYFNLPIEYREVAVDIPEVVYDKENMSALVVQEKEKILNNSELNISLDLYKNVIDSARKEEGYDGYLKKIAIDIEDYFNVKTDELKTKIREESIKDDKNEKMLIGLIGRLNKIEKQSDDFKTKFTDISYKKISIILETIEDTVPEDFDLKKDILLNLSMRDILNKLPDGFNQLTEDFDNLDKEALVSRLTNFIGNHVREHYINKKHGESDAIETDNKNLLKSLKKCWGTNDFEKGILPVMNNKLSELNNGQVSSRTRSISFVPSKGLMRIFSGDLGGACTSNQNLRLASGDFKDIVSYSLVLDKGNHDTERFVGSFLVIETETTEGEKAIVLRANNPAENLLNMVDGGTLIGKILEEFKNIAQRRGVTNTLVPMLSGVCSNRSQVAGYYSKKFNSNEKVGLKNNDETNFNRYSIWNKESSHYVVKI